MVKWESKFSVNVRTIDEQHKKLLDIMAKIDELAALNDDYDHYDELQEILSELKDYTIYHFNYEEELLSKSKYKDLESHQFEHSFFVKKLEKISRKDIDNQQKEAAKDIYIFLVDWISEHILKSDMQYKDTLKGCQ